ncbi:amidohydrolase family protein [Veronia pacifica]|uniref:Amidohydrolase n=1 Tax=Veronia pacifica TaxID=1080227 RepID=A0A1C3ELY8_9GAMM|nr:amidohydrolase family protein [Veronia pacifica]ODA34239.1 amidohydrolase [Veronia pacifica]
MRKIIDPHLHLFDLERGNYHWLKPENPPFWSDKATINRHFGEDSLRPPKDIELAGFVHIEAGFDNQAPWREVEWLEKTVDLPFRSIACVDLTQSESIFQQNICQLKAYPSLTGVRHILDEQASILLAKPEVIANLAYLAEQALLFEAQLSGSDERGVDALVAVIKSMPRLNVILNHAAFPAIHSMDQWHLSMQKLSALPNVFVKASGWEMTDRAFHFTFVWQALTQLIGYFGIKRVMLASNFPLCLFSHSYKELWQQYCRASLSDGALNNILHDNAFRLYRFDN